MLAWKNHTGLSNRGIAETLGVSAPSVGNWLTNDEAIIRQDNYEKIFPYIERFLSKKVDGLIENTSELRQFILLNCMKKGLSFHSISDRLGKEISPNDLEMLLSDKGTEFTPKTLSLICAILGISKDSLPITKNEKNILFIDAIVAKMVLTDVSFYNYKTFKKEDEIIRVTNLEPNKNYFAIRYIRDSYKIFLKANDILIISNDKPENGDAVYYNSQIPKKPLVGIFRNNDEYGEIKNDKGTFKLSPYDIDHGVKKGYIIESGCEIKKVIKVIRIPKSQQNKGIKY